MAVVASRVSPRRATSFLFWCKERTQRKHLKNPFCYLASVAPSAPTEDELRFWRLRTGFDSGNAEIGVCGDKLVWLERAQPGTL